MTIIIILLLQGEIAKRGRIPRAIALGYVMLARWAVKPKGVLLKGDFILMER